MKKRILAIVAAGLVAVSLMACSPEKKDEVATEQPTIVESEVTPETTPEATPEVTPEATPEQTPTVAPEETEAPSAAADGEQAAADQPAAEQTEEAPVE